MEPPSITTISKSSRSRSINARIRGIRTTRLSRSLTTGRIIERSISLPNLYLDCAPKETGWDEGKCVARSAKDGEGQPSQGIIDARVAIEAPRLPTPHARRTLVEAGKMQR